MVNFKSKPPENQQCGQNDKLTKANVRVALQVESNQLQANCWSAEGHRTATDNRVECEKGRLDRRIWPLCGLFWEIRESKHEFYS